MEAQFGCAYSVHNKSSITGIEAMNHMLSCVSAVIDFTPAHTLNAHTHKYNNTLGLKRQTRKLNADYTKQSHTHTMQLILLEIGLTAKKETMQ